MEQNEKKKVVIDRKNVLKKAVIGCACVGIASALLPITPLVGGLGLVATKTIPSWLRGHVFF